MNDMLNTPNKDVRVLINREVANELKRMMSVGDTYTSIIKGLIEKSKK